jgi:hypothetical protein
MAPTGAWVIKAAARRDACKIPQPPATIEHVFLADEHPLLLPLADERHELYFATAPTDAGSTARQLVAAHEKVARGFIELRTYLRGMDESGLRDFLSKGGGMIAEGPLPLMQSYCEVLEQAGCRPRIVREIDGRKPNPSIASNLKVLVLEPCAAIPSVDFQIRRMTDERKVEELIRGWRGW